MTSPPARPRLLIADDDRVVRSTLYLQLSGQFTVVGDASDADEAIEQADALQPDVAIIDVEMPAGGGLRAVREIRELSPRTAIVALSGDESAATVHALLDAGAMTYVRKGLSAAELSRTLMTAMTAHATLASQADSAVSD